MLKLKQERNTHKSGNIGLFRGFLKSGTLTATTEVSKEIATEPTVEEEGEVRQKYGLKR